MFELVRGVSTLVVVGVFASLAASPADGCSGKVLTSEELVDWTEVIVRVRAIREQAPGTPEKLGIVEFEVLEVIKGSTSSVTLRFPGQMQVYSGPNTTAPPYGGMRPTDVPGRCFATGYSEGKQYLLFLRRPHHFWHSIPRGDHGLTPYWTVLAPTTEEVSDDDDAWVDWVKAQLQSSQDEDFG